MTRTVAFDYDAGLTRADLQTALQQSEQLVGPLIALAVNGTPERTVTVGIHQPPSKANLRQLQLVESPGPIPPGSTAVATGSAYEQGQYKEMIAYR